MSSTSGEEEEEEIQQLESLEQGIGGGGNCTGGTRRWTAEEDDELRLAVTRHNGKGWKQIAAELPGRTHVQCLQRWKKVLKPGLVKGHWTPEEDRLLISLIQRQASDAPNWAEISLHISGRTAKQCRERWLLNLDPAIRKEPWSSEEDKLLRTFQARLGNKWAEIAALIPGRTENGVKSRFKSLTKREEKRFTKAEDEKVVLHTWEMGKHWDIVSREVPGRTKNAVKIRWRYLVRADARLEKPFYGGTKEEFFANGTRTVFLPDSPIHSLYDNLEEEEGEEEEDSEILPPFIRNSSSSLRHPNLSIDSYSSASPRPDQQAQLLPSSLPFAFDKSSSTTLSRARKTLKRETNAQSKAVKEELLALIPLSTSSAATGRSAGIFHPHMEELSQPSDSIFPTSNSTNSSAFVPNSNLLQSLGDDPVSSGMKRLITTPKKVNKKRQKLTNITNASSFPQQQQQNPDTMTRLGSGMGGGNAFLPPGSPSHYSELSRVNNLTSTLSESTGHDLDFDPTFLTQPQQQSSTRTAGQAASSSNTGYHFMPLRLHPDYSHSPVLGHRNSFLPLPHNNNNNNNSYPHASPSSTPASHLQPHQNSGVNAAYWALPPACVAPSVAMTPLQHQHHPFGETSGEGHSSAILDLGMHEEPLYAHTPQQMHHHHHHHTHLYGSSQHQQSNHEGHSSSYSAHLPPPNLTISKNTAAVRKGHQAAPVLSPSSASHGGFKSLFQGTTSSSYPGNGGNTDTLDMDMWFHEIPAITQDFLTAGNTSSGLTASTTTGMYPSVLSPPNGSPASSILASSKRHSV